MPPTNLGDTIRSMEESNLIDANTTLRDLLDQDFDPAAGMVVAWDRYVLVVARELDPNSPVADPANVLGNPNINPDTPLRELLGSVRDAGLDNKPGFIYISKDELKATEGQ